MVTKTADNAFKLERHLVDVLAPHAKQVVPGRATDTFAIHEWSMGRRIADLLLGVFSSAVPPDATWIPALKRVNQVEMYILAHALARPIKPGTIAKRLFMEDSKVRVLTENLCRRKLLEVSPSGAVRAGEWKRSIPGLTVAIEAKLHDWRGAIQQATTYVCLAEQSWIAVPTHVASQPLPRTLCQEHSIGLLGVSPEGEVTIMQSPGAPKKRCLHRKVHAIRVLQRYLKVAR